MDSQSRHIIVNMNRNPTMILLSKHYNCQVVFLNSTHNTCTYTLQYNSAYTLLMVHTTSIKLASWSIQCLCTVCCSRDSDSLTAPLLGTDQALLAELWQEYLKREGRRGEGRGGERREGKRREEERRGGEGREGEGRGEEGRGGERRGGEGRGGERRGGERRGGERREEGRGGEGRGGEGRGGEGRGGGKGEEGRGGEGRGGERRGGERRGGEGRGLTLFGVFYPRGLK